MQGGTDVREVQGHRGSGPRVSVVVPTYQGADHIRRCLTSLAEQSLAPSAFEVVVVRNGPLDATGDVVAAVRSAYPNLRLRQLTLTTAGAGRARNAGLEAARGEYVTFVDDDDRVSPEYLQTLLAHSGPHTVGLAHLADVVGDGDAPNFGVGPNRWQLRHDEAELPAERLPSALAYTVAKMVPTALARSVGFDTDLRSGEDIVFWARLLARSPFFFGLCPVAEHAVYYRSVRPNSVSRQALSFDFSITQRLDVIGRLEALAQCAPAAHGALNHMIAGQTGLMNMFLREQPERHHDVVQDIRARGLRSVPFRRLNEGVARDLAILYVALPFNDTSAIVAARRVRERGQLVDVVSNDMSSIRSKDPEAGAIWHEFVGRTLQARSKPSLGGWPAIASFCRQGLEAIESWEEVQGPYRTVYSRAMWPASHLLAALYKLRRPQVHWTAEFSDPLLHGITGEERASATRVDEWLLAELRGGLQALGITPPDGANLYLWTEAVAYALADSIMFTNDHQRDYMLDYFPDRALAERASGLSHVSAHPTLPREFYDLGTAEYELEPGTVNIAYFGVFYATRGLTEVTEALQRLSPQARQVVRLHVFTTDPAALAQELRAVGLQDVVVPNPYVSYLDFLHLTTRFDVLLVNDARTLDTHDVNPYLPSKWSDYHGSGRPIWGVVEPGSVLSSRPLQHRTELGDVDGAVAVLEQLARTAGQRLERAVGDRPGDAVVLAGDRG